MPEGKIKEQASNICSVHFIICLSSTFANSKARALPHIYRHANTNTYATAAAAAVAVALACMHGTQINTHTHCIFIIYTRSEDQSLAKSYIVQLVYQLYPNKMPSTCTHEWMSFSILALSFHKSTYSNWVNAGNMHLYFDSIFCCWFVHFLYFARLFAHSLTRSSFVSLLF